MHLLQLGTSSLLQVSLTSAASNSPNASRTFATFASSSMSTDTVTPPFSGASSRASGLGLPASASDPACSLPAVFSSLVIFLEAIAAAAFAWLLLGEAVAPVQVLGGVVIIIGIWIARPRESRQAASQVGAAA